MHIHEDQDQGEIHWEWNGSGWETRRNKASNAELCPNKEICEYICFHVVIELRNEGCEADTQTVMINLVDRTNKEEGKFNADETSTKKLDVWVVEGGQADFVSG